MDSSNGNKKTGYISLFRSIKNHWIFENDKWFKWWVLMLFEVNHKSNKITLGYDVFDVERGHSAKSLRTWGKLFDCTPKTVLKFFKLLEKNEMILKKTIGKGKHSTTLINITNYEDYQGGEETQRTTQRTTQGKRNVPTNNNVNKENNENNVNNENINIYSFEDFWKKYPNKIAKAKVKSKYEKLPVSKKEKIFKTLDDFLEYKPFDSYHHPNPETYINQERWEDEIQKPKTKEEILKTRSNQINYAREY